MIQYTWRIHSLTKETVSGVDDVVVSITWEKIGVDTEDYRKGSVKLNTIFTDNQLKTDNFIAFENLKKKDVINWIKSIVNEERINNQIEDEIQKSRANRMHITEKDFPWNNKEE